MCKLKKVIYVCCDGKTEPRRRYGFGAATKRDLSRDKEWMVAVLQRGDIRFYFFLWKKVI
jgi:hypothetical protein